MIASSVLASLLGAGCFTPAPEPLVFETLPFENDYTQATSIVLQPFTYDDLLCPDGEPAAFYAVYRTDITEAAPIVIVFHSGALDYVKAPNLEDPLAGAHLTTENRMTAEWASSRVFQTLGLLQDDDTVEINAGTLPAALADANAFTLYPANCWGDLWHNEDSYSPNLWDADGGVHRQGRFLAWAMTRFASKDPSDATSWRSRFGLDALPIPLDASGVTLIGLGEGGRAMSELYRRIADAGDANFPTIDGILIDSTMDNLYPINYAPTGYEEQKAAYARIFPEESTGDIGMYSLDRWLREHALTNPLSVIWSSADPRVPDESISGLISLESMTPAVDALMEVTDMAEARHVFINNDIQLAREQVDVLLGP